MVDVTHDRDDGRAGHQIRPVLFRHHGVAEHILRRLFRLVFEIDPHVRREQRRVVVIDGIVDALHDAFLEEPLGDLHRRDAEFLRKHFQGNFLRRDHRVVDLDRLDLLLLLLFGSTQLAVARLILVEILHRHPLLPDEGALGDGFLLHIRLIVRLFLGRSALFLGQDGRRRHRSGAGRSPARGTGSGGTGGSLRARTIAARICARVHVHARLGDIHALFLSVAEIPRGAGRRGRGGTRRSARRRTLRRRGLRRRLFRRFFGGFRRLFLPSGSLLALLRRFRFPGLFLLRRLLRSGFFFLFLFGDGHGAFRGLFRGFFRRFLCLFLRFFRRGLCGLLRFLRLYGRLGGRLSGALRLFFGRGRRLRDLFLRLGQRGFGLGNGGSGFRSGGFFPRQRFLFRPVRLQRGELSQNFGQALFRRKDALLQLAELFLVQQFLYFLRIFVSVCCHLFSCFLPNIFCTCCLSPLRRGLPKPDFYP